MAPDIARVVTERFIAALQKGTVPWHQPWTSYGRPYNATSKHHYRGVNAFLLTIAGYGDPRWMTFHQAKSAGGNVRKGEHGWPIVFYKMLEVVDDDTGEKRNVPLLRYTTAFNVLQIDGLKLPELELPNQACEISEIEGFVASTGITVRYGEDKAYYSPFRDLVNMPIAKSFESTESLYATLFHEMTHATGHPNRLNRFANTQGDHFERYSKEELVAEIGATLLLNEFGICTDGLFDNSAAYIASWIKHLSDDPKLIISAASQAEKAFDFLFAQENKEVELA